MHFKFLLYQVSPLISDSSSQFDSSNNYSKYFMVKISPFDKMRLNKMSSNLFVNELTVKTDFFHFPDTTATTILTLTVKNILKYLIKSSRCECLNF